MKIITPGVPPPPLPPPPPPVEYVETCSCGCVFSLVEGEARHMGPHYEVSCPTCKNERRLPSWAFYPPKLQEKHKRWEEERKDAEARAEARAEAEKVRQYRRTFKGRIDSWLTRLEGVGD